MQENKSKFSGRKIFLLVFILLGFLMSGFALPMSFSSQAPEGDWSEPWYNDCEEVSIVMVDSFYNNRVLTPAVAKKEILRIIGIKEKAYGASLDENADEMVDIINNFLNWKARVVENPTIDDIKEEVKNGRPVLLPADGRKLNNRYYTTNEYHVFVISGYDDDKKTFIVQDAGTYRGHDYQYSYEVVMNAMHDYDPIDLSKGRRVAIFTAPATVSPAVSSEVAITPAPTVAINTSAPLSSGDEINENNLPANSDLGTKDSGFFKIIAEYLTRLVEWFKKVLGG